MTRPGYTEPASEAVAALLGRSNRLGSDPKNTNYAGGNTSAKGTQADPVTGQPTELLWVKGSGGDLGTLQAAGLAVLRLDALRALTHVYPGADREDEMVAAFDFCAFGLGRWGDGGKRSVAPRRPSTPPCTASSRPRTSTTCIPTRASRSRPRPTARSWPPSASAAGSPGCPGGAQASSSAWTSPRSGRRTRTRSG